jgi:hypothetical protein
MQKWGGKFGRSIPVENIVGTRTKGNEFHHGSNEFNLKHELPTEDIAAIMVPKDWGVEPEPPADLGDTYAVQRYEQRKAIYDAGKADMEKVKEYLARINPEAEIIYTDNSHDQSVAKEFIKEHNIQTGFHRVENQTDISDHQPRKINVGDIAMINPDMPVQAWDNAEWNGTAIPVFIHRVFPDGRIIGKVMVDKLEKFSPEQVEKLKSEQMNLISSSGAPVEFEVNPKAIRWLRTPLNKMVQIG